MKSYLQFLKIICFIIISIILLTEIVLRIGFQDKLRTRVRPTFYTPDTIIGYKFIPHADGEIIRPSINHKIKINNQGFHGPDFTFKKDPGTFRIVFSGTSDLAGNDTDGLKDYTIMLQELFNKESSNIEVINCGIDGDIRLYHNIYLIKNELIKYDPDLILLEDDRFPLRSEVVFRQPYKDFLILYPDYRGSEIDTMKTYLEKNFYRFNIFKFTYDNSYIFRYLCKYFTENSNKITKWIEQNLNIEKSKISYYITKNVSMGSHTYSTTIDESVNAIIDLKEFLDRKGIDFAIYSSYQKIGSKIKKYFFESLNEIKYLNLDIPSDPSLRLEYDSHSNQLGHKLISEKLFIKLIGENLVQGNQVNANGSKIDNSENKIQDKILNSSNLKIDLSHHINLSHLKDSTLLQRNDYKIIFVHSQYKNTTFPRYFTDNLRDLFPQKIIKINDLLLPDNFTIADYLEILDNGINSFTPNLILLEIPYYMLRRNPEDALMILDDYLPQLTKFGIKSAFYTFQNNEIESFLQYMCTRSSIQKCYDIGTRFTLAFYQTREPNYVENIKQKIAVKYAKDILVYNYIPNQIKSLVDSFYLNKYVPSSNPEKGFSCSVKFINNGIGIYTYSKASGYPPFWWNDNPGTWFKVDSSTIILGNNVSISPYDIARLKAANFQIKNNLNLSNDSLEWQSKLWLTNDSNNEDIKLQKYTFSAIHYKFIKTSGTLLLNNKSGYYQIYFSELEVIKNNNNDALRMNN